MYDGEVGCMMGMYGRSEAVYPDCGQEDIYQ